VIDVLFAKWNSKNAFPYQAGELTFYELHAKLWLLIAIARVAIDHPRRVFRHQATLKRVALGKGSHHVLLRHFASQALLQCAKDPENHLSNAQRRRAANVNESLLPRVKAPRSYGNSFYEGRPASLPEPAFEFYLDYEFGKYEVSSVGNAFGRPIWEVRDAITNWVRTSDQKIKGMYETGGRDAGNRSRFTSMNPEHHGYGQYLGWHGLYEVAGQFLAKYPIATTEYENEPWKSWLDRQILTRADGLWLSDGIDRPPLCIQVNLLETGKNEVGLTYNKEKLLDLVGIRAAIPNYLLVCGDWRSADNIRVRVSSALVPPGDSRKMARRLAKEEPFGVHLPFFEEDVEPVASLAKRQEKASEWTTRPSITTTLDTTDPYGASSAVERPRFTTDIESLFSLKPADAFNREWVDGSSRKIAKAEAWGCHKLHEDENSINGERLMCSKAFLRKVLATKKSELLLLVVLQRYDKGYGSESGKYWHTTAIIRVNRSLDFAFYAGASNRFHQMKY
jgi:hypothetical protein